MKFVVGKLHTGRKNGAGRQKIQRHLQLHCASLKGVQGDLKGATLKIVFDYQVRSLSVLTRTGIFFLPHQGSHDY